jgi:hypothetical protein
MTDRKLHWETIYEKKQPNEVSWTQEVPQISLNFIKSLQLSKSDAIIDVGGGESKLVDFLLDEGFENITVLDISAHAIDRAKKRLGDKANKVTWIVSDILEFIPSQNYDCWHDRAAFHFLTNPEEIHTYVELVNKYANKNLVIGTFSTEGPLKCSGLEITQYNESSLTKRFSSFGKLECKTENHTTPFNTQQNFIFCSFQKTNS